MCLDVLVKGGVRVSTAWVAVGALAVSVRGMCLCVNQRGVCVRRYITIGLHPEGCGQSLPNGGRELGGVERGRG